MKLNKEQAEALQKVLKGTHGMDIDGSFPRNKEGKLKYKNHSLAFSKQRESIMNFLEVMGILGIDENDNPIIKAEGGNIVLNNGEDVYNSLNITKKTSKIMNGRKPKSLNVAQIDKIKMLHKEDKSLRQISQEMGIGKDTVSKVIKGIY